MKIILLRGNGRAPIKVQIDRWTLVMPVLFLGAVSLIVMSLFAGNDASFVRATSDRGIHNIKKVPQRTSVGGISGVSNEPNSRHINETSLLASIKNSESKLAKQKKRLKLLQTMGFRDHHAEYGVNNNLVLKKKLGSIHSYTRPVEIGFISSKYGMRTDPINGKYRKHSGIDIAAKKGSPIKAIGSGFVTYVGTKGGYGKVIEIHHSDTLKTRYAHLNKILVEEGDVVRQGFKIAEMGKTGRATGSHLHFEVWKNGVAVNPKQYVNVALERLVSK